MNEQINRLSNQTKTSVGVKEPDELHFKSNGILTLGVELELQLIDAESYNLCAKAEQILAATRHLANIKPEFYLNTIELNTDKCSNVQHVERNLFDTLATLHDLTKNFGVVYATTGSHPFAKYSDGVVSSTPRYKDLIDKNQWISRRMSVYGLHVHLGMSSGEECIRFNNFFMHFLPHLLALSASSPFWQGIDTGLASCRPTTYEALPTAGQPYPARNWQDFQQLYKTLKSCGSIQSMKDLWWDLRPSPVFGTLEIRVCDGAATLAETLGLVALIHTLAHWFADNGSWLEVVDYPCFWLARENKWRALRYGLDAELVINTQGKTKLLREDLDDWFTKLAPYSTQLGYEAYFLTLKAIMNYGTSSERQRKVFQRTQCLTDIVKHNVSEFYLQSPLYKGEVAYV